MTIDDDVFARWAREIAGPEGVDVEAAARDLVAGLLARPWGHVSPSVYESGRLVTLAPWLTGHDRRVEYLIETQRRDGGWGAPGGYAMVPTLSAVEAFLTMARRSSIASNTDVSHAADRGLRRLSSMLGELGPDDIPDMPAIDLIAASLIEAINAHLGAMPGRFSGRFSLPEGLDDARLAAIRSVLAARASVPDKLLHALEVTGTPARYESAVQLGTTGVIGASPAATAAWLGERGAIDSGDPARVFLEAVGRLHGGPVPCGIPITVFERAWVLATLARAGIQIDVPAELLTSLEAAAEPGGTPAGDGLPKDADTTSVALYALGMCGFAYPPESLGSYDTGSHFCTWLGEDGFSVSVNAHAMEAIGRYMEMRPDAGTGYAETVARLARLLREHQLSDGSWTDRWHASPYYATVSCALALRHFGGPESSAAVGKAVRWVLDSQRADGSWGRWGGTAEETAYAIQVLLLTAPPLASGSHRAAAERGSGYLLRTADSRESPALWHDKDLYRPTAIVRAAILAALHLVSQNA